MMHSVLRRFRVEGFKSLADVELAPPRVAVLIGPNAAGKSNLLDAFQMLARAGTERTLTDALSAPIRGFPQEAFTLPRGGLPELLNRDRATFTLEADLDMERPSTRGSREQIRYRIQIEINPDSGVLSVADEYLVKLSRAGEPKEQPRIERDDGSLLVRRSGKGGRPQYEPVAANHSLLSDARLSGSPYPLFDQVRDELRHWRTYYLDPGGRMRDASPPRQVEHIGAHGEHLAPFLFGLKSRDDHAFAAVQRALRSVIPSIGSLGVDLDAKRGTLDIEIEQDGTTFSSRVISEGTLRVLALCTLAVTAGPKGLIAFEEPENGVSPQRIDRIAELLASIARRGRSQLVVTTHSPAFAAAMLGFAREQGTDIGLFATGREGPATTIRRIPDPGPLFADPAVEKLVAEPDEGERLAAAIGRGWLDG